VDRPAPKDEQNDADEDEEVLKDSKVSRALTERTTNEQLRNLLEGLSEDDLGRYKMYARHAAAGTVRSDATDTKMVD